MSIVVHATTTDPRAAVAGPDGSRHALDARRRVCAFVLIAAFVASIASAQTETIRVDLRLRTGGALGGFVVDHDESGLVVVHERTPYAFAWDELDPGSAYATRRKLSVLDRGGEENLSAKDHLELGMFALRHGRRDLAANEFRRAKRLDDTCGPIIKKAVDEYRRLGGASTNKDDSLAGTVPITSTERQHATGLATLVGATLGREQGAALAPLPAPDCRDRVLDVYKTFGAKVQEVMGKDVVLVESDHFLIWTDWEPGYRNRLVEWCESMYAALCARFDLDATEDIFLAKCPVFCWRSKNRFLEFARQFDGYGGSNAIGYTRSIQQNGHVHVVLVRLGRSEADFDRFACTLVHEGTHAFLHRLCTSRLIPHWVNEGFAEMTTERVLGDRCSAGETARLLARQFVRYDWPITRLLHSSGPIAVHEYPLAHSVIAYLESLDSGRFAGFLRGLKAGKTTGDALKTSYDGLTIDGLEAQWRSAVRRGDPALSEPSDNDAVLPWSTDR